jgi:hypothetical protein
MPLRARPGPAHGLCADRGGWKEETRSVVPASGGWANSRHRGGKGTERDALAWDQSPAFPCPTAPAELHLGPRNRWSAMGVRGRPALPQSMPDEGQIPRTGIRRPLPFAAPWRFRLTGVHPLASAAQEWENRTPSSRQGKPQMGRIDLVALANLATRPDFAKPHRTAGEGTDRVAGPLANGPIKVQPQAPLKPRLLPPTCAVGGSKQRHATVKL